MEFLEFKLWTSTIPQETCIIRCGHKASFDKVILTALENTPHEKLKKELKIVCENYCNRGYSVKGYWDVSQRQGREYRSILREIEILCRIVRD